MKERIQKILANAGVASRRAVERLVVEGRVEVNDEVVRDLPVLVDPAKDKIKVDGQRVRLKPPGRAGAHNGPAGHRQYFLVYKPAGVYATNVAQGAQKRVLDLLPKDFTGRVYPVGRLDADSRGLILLTNDGDLTNELTHPRFGVSKTYRATIAGEVPDRDIATLEKGGVWLADKAGRGFKSGKMIVRLMSRTPEQTVLEIIVREGKNRELRRILAKLGHRLRDLLRTKMGPLTLDGLKPGKVRQLTPKEIRLLKQLKDRPKPEKPDARERAPDADASDAVEDN
jgi:23S rRNA pseudouridine2605 synthase